MWLRRWALHFSTTLGRKCCLNTPSSPPLPSPPSPHRQVQRLCGQHLWLGGRSRVQDPRVRLSGLRRQPGPCDWQRAPPVRPEAEPPRGGHCAAPAQVRWGEWDLCHMTERLLWWCAEECYGLITLCSIWNRSKTGIVVVHITTYYILRILTPPYIHM